MTSSFPPCSNSIFGPIRITAPSSKADSSLTRASQAPAGTSACWLVDEAVEQAEAWVKNLPIAPEFALQAQRAAHVPWLRFRTQVLKRIGKRPMGPVY